MTNRRSIGARFVRWTGIAAVSLIAAVATLWTFAAVYFDGPSKLLVPALAIATLAVLVFVRHRWRRMAVFSVWFIVVLAWWLTLKPSNHRDWQADVAQSGWAEINGDEITLHNVRNCDYHTDTDFTPLWETRTVRLSNITGIDLAVCYWGSPYMAHPIASFQFADAPPLCFSIETRKEIGETYSAIGGLFRRYELTYVMADERDVIRLRTNLRHGEDVYLYRLVGTPEMAQQRFLDYIATLNELHHKPRWYNAVTTNCTTSIRTQHHAAQRMAWDWRILVNGLADEMMYERGILETGGLQFEELRSKSLINDAARLDGGSAEFSRRIRLGRPGFPEFPPSGS